MQESSTVVVSSPLEGLSARVLNSLNSEHSRRAYEIALREFFLWYEDTATGHALIQTTEGYLGIRQDLQDAPCDCLGIRVGKGRGERTARPVPTSAHSNPARTALQLSPRPQKFVHRIDRSHDANAY